MLPRKPIEYSIEPCLGPFQSSPVDLFLFSNILPPNSTNHPPWPTSLRFERHTNYKHQVQTSITKMNGLLKQGRTAKIEISDGITHIFVGRSLEDDKKEFACMQRRQRYRDVLFRLVDTCHCIKWHEFYAQLQSIGLSHDFRPEWFNDPKEVVQWLERQILQTFVSSQNIDCQF